MTDKRHLSDDEILTSDRNNPAGNVGHDGGDADGTDGDSTDVVDGDSTDVVDGGDADATDA